MSLGTDHLSCKDEYVQAMRARLAAEAPALAGNVDHPGVQQNFGALAEALFRILTLRAEVASDVTADAVFWQWVTQLASWSQALSTWQTGVRSAFSAWAPTSATDLALRSAVLALPSPGTAPTPPAALRGRIR